MFDNGKGKAYFGEEFVEKIYSIFNAYGDSNFTFVHRTMTQNDAEEILRSPEFILGYINVNDKTFLQSII